MGRNPKSVLTNSRMLSIIIEQDCRCAYCNCELFGSPIEWDHFIPFATTGTTNVNGLVASCKRCNRKKSSRVFDEDGLIAFISEVMSDYGEIADGPPDGHVELWTRLLT